MLFRLVFNAKSRIRLRKFHENERDLYEEKSFLTKKRKFRESAIRKKERKENFERGKLR